MVKYMMASPAEVVDLGVDLHPGTTGLEDLVHVFLGFVKKLNLITGWTYLEVFLFMHGRL
jgi:hypothetical protein